MKISKSLKNTKEPKKSSKRILKGLLVISWIVRLAKSISCGQFQYVHEQPWRREECDENGENCIMHKGVTYSCRNCVAPCYTCSSPGSCNSCIPANEDYFHKNYCYDKCPTRLWDRNATLTCSDCHPNCKDCYDDSQDSCVSCEVGLSLNPDGTCKRKCPNGYYSTSAADYRCQKCHPNCKECFDGTKYSCTKCVDSTPFLLPDGSCSTTCSHGEYLSGRNCLECHNDCDSCYSGTKTNCLVCKNNYLVSAFNGFCAPECEEKSYQFNITHCKLCESGCKKCIGEGFNNCLECSDGILRTFDSIYENWDEDDPETQEIIGVSYRSNYHRECRIVCREGFYEDSGECKRCYGTCRACSGPLETDCLNCVTNMTLISSNNTCSCNEGHFNFFEVDDQRGGYCDDCFLGCSLCNSKAQGDCFKCQKGYFLKYGECVRECGEGYYGDQVAIPTGYEACHTCHESCVTCNEETENDCLSCSAAHVKIDYTSGGGGGLFGRCFDCFNQFSEVEVATTLCPELKHLRLTKANEPLDGYSSFSFKITFEDQLDFRKRLAKMSNLTDYFELKFQEGDNDLKNDSFTYKIVQMKKEFALHINFTRDGGTLKGELTPLNPIIIFEKGRPRLTFANKTNKFELKMLRNEEGSSINEVDQFGGQIKELISYIADGLTGALGLSTFLGGSNQFITKLIRLFATISR